jgi:hypothetical protein
LASSQAPAAARPLTTEEVASLLRATADSARAELSDLSEDIASWHPAEGEWCAKECLGHVMEAEVRGFAGRIRLILEEPGRDLESWDQVEVQRGRNDCAHSMRDLLDAFLKMRAESVRLVESLRNVDLDKSGEHETVGTLRVDELLHEWIHHDHNHYRQLQANIQAYVWRSMGNARRFTELEA